MSLLRVESGHSRCEGKLVKLAAHSSFAISIVLFPHRLDNARGSMVPQSKQISLEATYAQGSYP